MKLNQRDKLILIGVLVVLIWVVGIVVFIKPAIEAVNTASETLDSKEMELTDLSQQVEDEKNLPDEVDAAYAKSQDVASIFYPRMLQHQAMTEVQTQFDVNKDQAGQEINNLNLAITQISSISIPRYVFNPYSSSTDLDNMLDSLGTDPNAEQTVDQVQIGALNNYTMQFTFNARKADLLTFLDNLNTNSHRSLVVNDLSISDIGENNDDTELEGSMTLDFIMAREMLSLEEYEAAIDAAAAEAANDTAAE